MSAAQSSGPPRPQKRAGFLQAMRYRPRLLICTALAVLVFFAVPSDHGAASRALVAWNLATWTFIALVLTMMRRDSRESIRRHATLEEENPWVVLVLGNIAATAAMAAIVWELGPIKDMKGLVKGEHIALVAATILSAWTFIHVQFALHYAGEYYARPRHHHGAGAHRGGLEFIGGVDPGWTDFLYQAFAIGCSCATSDVNTNTTAMRAAILVHSVVSFFFNTIILALTINIGAGFF